MHETDIPTERAQTRQDSRFSQADVDQGGSRGHQVAAGERSPASVGVIDGYPATPPRRRGVGPIRSRRTFEALRRSPSKGRSGPLTVSFLEQPAWSRPEVAYAISRRVGGAVVRNQLKRRLRAIVAERAPFLPVGAYVVRTGPGGPLLDFDELKVAMSQALEKATNHRGAGIRPPRADAIGGIR
jgi:ribonuclease P protein component